MVLNTLELPSWRGGIYFSFHWNWVDCVALLNTRICQDNKICASSWALKTDSLHFLSLGTLVMGEASQHVRSLTTLRLSFCEEAKANHLKRSCRERMWDQSRLQIWVKKTSVDSRLNCHLTVTVWGILSENNPDEPVDPPEEWKIIISCSNLLSFRMACYIAIDNKNRFLSYTVHTKSFSGGLKT